MNHSRLETVRLNWQCGRSRERSTGFGPGGVPKGDCTQKQVFRSVQFVLNSRERRFRRGACTARDFGDRGLRKHQLKGLILAQNERWRCGLGMQVVREM